jgi:muramoyltetrapeptide carboxypeptidase
MDEARDWGFSLVAGANLNATHRFNAGTEVQRAADLVWALTDPSIDAVWFARGGYGTARLLDQVPWSEVDRRPVIGFSDATALFSAFAARGVGRGIHAPVLHSLVDLADERSRDALRRLLTEGVPTAMPGWHLAGPDTSAQAPVVGGNLCVLASLAGTPWALEGRDRIVLLEDVGEAPYRVDRMLGQLVDSGGLTGAVGIALGRFIGCEAPADVAWELHDVIRDRLAPLGVPVIAGLPVGHGADNIAWVQGSVGMLGGGGIVWTDVDPG